MDVKVVDAGPCRKVLTVQAPADAVAGDYAATVKSVAAVARLPGFRPGKAPLPVVEKRFAREIAEETKERLVPRLYREALKQEGLVPVAIVEVRDVIFARDTGLGFHVTVDVAPDFKLPAYSRIAITEQPVEVKDQQVEDLLQRLRERLARFAAVSGRAAQAHDLLRVDFDATCEGRPLSELAPREQAMGEARDFLVYLGDPEFLPGFNAGLTGAAVAETRELAVTFPADHPTAALAGRTAAYRVTIKEVQERLLPAIDAEFLKRFGVETEADLRTRLQADLLETAKGQARRHQIDEIIKHLLEKTPFELPQSVVEEETRQTVRNMVQDISRRGGTREQMVEQQQNIVEEATRGSTERVRLSYILGRIADAENIVVEDAALEEHLKVMAARYEMPIERFREEMEKRRAIDGLRREMRAEKTLDFLLKEARIK